MRNGFWTFKPVWVSLSPLWDGCCTAGKLPSTLFYRFIWASPSGGRKKVHSLRWFNSAKFKEGFISYQRCHLCGAAFPHRCSSDLLMWVRFRHLKLRWAGQIRLHLLTVGKTKLMILVNLPVSSLISHISRGESCLWACVYNGFKEVHRLKQSLQTGEPGGTLTVTCKMESNETELHTYFKIALQIAEIFICQIKISCEAAKLTMSTKVAFIYVIVF